MKKPYIARVDNVISQSTVLVISCVSQSKFLKDNRNLRPSSSWRPWSSRAAMKVPRRYRFAASGTSSFQVKIIIFSKIKGYTKFLPWAFSNFPLITAI